MGLYKSENMGNIQVKTPLKASKSTATIYAIVES
jgi:hypothetical protein